MTNLPEHEPIPFTHSADETDRTLMGDLMKHMRMAPDSVDTSLEIYTQDPEVVAQVIECLGANLEHYPSVKSIIDLIDRAPEQYPILRTVALAFAHESDYLLDFPDDLTKEIRDDPEYKRLEELEAVTLPEAKEAVRIRKRGFWVRKAAEHAA